MPLPDSYRDNLARYGHPYDLRRYETLNLEHYACPLCWATDRDRLYALYIRDYLKDKWAGVTFSLVDFAPGQALSRFIRRLVVQVPGVSYRTADLHMEGVDDQVDLTDMRAYADQCFDFFICSHVLEHVQNDRKAMRELWRILKPGGQGILMVPINLQVGEIDEDPTVTDVAERWRRFGQGDHVRLYSKVGFVARVEEAGFEVRQLGQGLFGPAVFMPNGITPQSILYIVKKR